MLNSVAVIGNLGADPEIKVFENSMVARFTLYVNERRTNSNGQVEPVKHRFPVEIWGKGADFASKYLHSGSRVGVQGSLRENTWQSDGQNRSRIVIRANRVENLTPKDSDTETAAEYDDNF